MSAVPLEIDAFGKTARVLLDLDPERPGEHNILTWLQGGKLYEPDVSWVLLRVLEEGDAMVDVGGHVGYFTLLAAALVGPTGRVVAFEPDPDNYRRLCAQVQANGFDHVSAVNNPVTASGEPMKFFTNRDNDGGHALWDPGEFKANVKSREEPMAETVDTVTLAGALPEHGVDGPPKLLKIDTEGAEPLVLEGAGDLLGPDGIPFVVAELHGFGLERMGSSPAALRRMMVDRGYGTFLLPFSGGLPKLVPPGVEIKSPYILNLLFAAPERLAAYWPEIAVEHPEQIA